MSTTNPKQSSPNIDVLCRLELPLLPPAHHGSGNYDSHLVVPESPQIDAAPVSLCSGSACTAKCSASITTMLPTTGMKLEERMQPTMRMAKAVRDKARKTARKYMWTVVALNAFTIIATTLGAGAIGELIPPLSPNPSSVAMILAILSVLFSMFSFFIAHYLLYQYSVGKFEEALRQVWELEAFVNDLRRFIVYDNSSVTALLEIEKTVAHDRRRYEMIRRPFRYDDGTELFRKVEDMLITWRMAAGVASEQGKRSEVDGLMRGD